MNAKIDKQVEFWALLGPLLLMLTLMIASIRPQQSLMLPIIALLGLAFCWKWKLSGLPLALGILVLACGWHMATHPGALLWNLTFCLAIGLSFAVTALSYSEVEHVLHSLQRESAKQLEDFLHLSEKIQTLESEKSKELNYETILAELNERVDLLTTEKQLLEEIANKGRQEIHELKILESQKACQLEESQNTIEHLQKRTALHAQELLAWRAKAEELLATCHEKELLMKGEIDETYIRKLQLEQQVYNLQEQVYGLEEDADKQSHTLEEMRQELEVLHAELELNQLELERKGKEPLEHQEIALEKALIATEEELALLERRYEEDVDQLHSLIETLLHTQPHPLQAPQAIPPSKERPASEENLVKKQASTKSKAPPPKAQTPTTKALAPKPAKPKKTNVWANAILSRWSEPHDPSQ